MCITILLRTFFMNAHKEITQVHTANTRMLADKIMSYLSCIMFLLRLNSPGGPDAPVISSNSAIHVQLILFALHGAGDRLGVTVNL